MGSVYLAEDQSVGQQVAIKIVRTEDSEFGDGFSREEAMGRFKQEARAIATLDHLHILPLYRYGEEEVLGGVQAYMVMQYRPEGSLWDWLRRRAGQKLGEPSQVSDAGVGTPLPAGLPTDWPLSITEAADYLQQASSALQYAHDRGIIHRDVKPANFLLRFDRNPATNTTSAFLLLSDFGLAKFFTSGTATNSTLGTPLYMAPEQFYSNAGPASDQYALAVMIYYLLAGRTPFMGDAFRMMHQHLNVAPPPIRTFVPSLSSGIEAILNRALAKRIEDRYPSIGAFAEDFLQCVNDAPLRPATLTSNTPLAPTVAASPVSPVLSPRMPQPQMTPYPTGQMPFATGPGPAAVPANIAPPFSPPPPPPSGATPLAQQPSRSTVQNWDQGARVQPGGQMATPVGLVGAGMGATIAPKRSQRFNVNKRRISRREALGLVIGVGVVVGLGAGVYVYESRHHLQGTNSQTAQGITPRYFLTGHSDEVRSLSWSPDGKKLASGSLDTTVRVWNVAAQQTILIYPGHRQGVEAVAWSQNAGLIASGGRDDLVRIWDSTTGENQIITPGLGSEVSSLAWTVDGASVLVGTLGSGLRDITVVDASVAPIGPKTLDVDTIALSPNGQLLATGLKSGLVTISSVADKRLPPLFNLQRSVLGLAWSPDSQALAIGGNEQKVEILDIATKKVVKSKTTSSGVNGLAWATDNTNRLAIAQVDGTVGIWDIPNDTLISGTGHQGPVIAVAWGNKALASGSADKTVIVWNT